MTVSDGSGVIETRRDLAGEVVIGKVEAHEVLEGEDGGRDEAGEEVLLEQVTPVQKHGVGLEVFQRRGRPPREERRRRREERSEERSGVEGGEERERRRRRRERKR
ncbi:hypothetical protein Vadar_013521 [Vaccinium darrowii]|uniref:Uncharacterized protein n=1 Tax=Vaccinium darrowii TaxID=229202 RepID=A0ACB7ZCF2_9ERIC|nr:hypothetical protein Vadar_013521 [Vaccinium darrowii]